MGDGLLTVTGQFLRYLDLCFNELSRQSNHPFYDQDNNQDYLTLIDEMLKPDFQCPESASSVKALLKTAKESGCNVRELYINLMEDINLFPWSYENLDFYLDQWIKTPEDKVFIRFYSNYFKNPRSRETKEL